MITPPGLLSPLAQLKKMSHRRKSHGGPPHNMSELLLGSVPDEQSPDTNRLLRSRTTNSNDPFLSEPHSRYLLSRPVILEPPFIDSRNDLHGNMANKTVAMPFSSNTSLYMARRSESIEYDQAGSLRTAEKSSCDTPLRQMSINYSETQSELPGNSTHGIGKAEYSGHTSQTGTLPAAQQTRRRPLNQDEFDGPTQLLPSPMAEEEQVRAQALPDLPFRLNPVEQDEVIRRYSNTLALCAFHFVAKYQFPVPLEKDKPPIRHASDRDWTEWAYLLKRLATKRRIPARVLHEKQIKHLVTVLENSIPIRNARSRDSLDAGMAMKDDRYLLQLVSAGIQVAKILMDSLAMQELIALYVDTEAIILRRR